MPQASPTPRVLGGLPAAVGPAELLGGLLQNGPQTVVLQVRQAKGQRIGRPACASSSMNDSRAKWLAVAARAR